MKRRLLFLGTLIGVVAGMIACATSPLGRKQMMLVSDQQMDALGRKAFQEIKEKTPVVHDAAIENYVRCVSVPITEAARDQLAVSQWDLVVFQDSSANAFALPGGEIGVNTGLLSVAQTDAQLAAVVGHEVGHVIARHGAERMSEALVAQGGLALIDAFILGKSVGDQKKKLILGALGIGTQLGVILPHSRTQESEADLIGLHLMARAGFDPQQSVELWKNMIRSSRGEAPPEWLSTHPASESRITNLEQNLSSAQVEYQRAVHSGRRPLCRALF